MSTSCPKCDGVMVERKGKYGTFYGCSNYPRCKHTMKYLPKVEKPVEDASELLDEVLESPKDKKEFTPSKYQQAIFDFVQNGNGNAVVEAVAGSGKTSTIVKALEFTSENLEVAFLAFNKKIAEELKERSPKHVHVSTLHSLGFTNIRKVYPKVKVDAGKVRWIIKDELEGMTAYFQQIIETNMNAVIRLVSMLKATLLEPTNDNLTWIADNYNIEVNGDWQQIYQMVKIAFEKSNSETWRIDYDDMIYFCASGKVECKKFDWLFVDEAQDLNSSQVEMILHSIHKDSRVICVGDKKQSIYMFRGADTNAIPYLTEKLNAVTLPLSISYRCPKAHVVLAQTLVPQIEASETAKEGVLETIKGRDLLNKVKVGDLVICRTNAPLVSPAFELIRNGIKAVILGRDIGKGLLDLIEKTEKRNSIGNLSQLVSALSEYQQTETGKLLAQNKEAKAQHLQDSIETIFALSDGCNTISELKERIETVFSDNQQGVVFSSIHKAKGSEAERVFILHPELMPHPMALKSSNPEALQQELNIKYVALTRSKSELYFVEE
jgi:DNA helicase-2/ATP-dependent DNA helicase PcrA